MFLVWDDRTRVRSSSSIVDGTLPRLSGLILLYITSTLVTGPLTKKNFAYGKDAKYCLIVNEAQQESQMTFVSSAFAIDNSATKGLVTIQFGDPNQQGPLNITASVDVSLNEFTRVAGIFFLMRLQKQHFPGIVRLTQQNRMSQDIILPINVLVYGNSLVSGFTGKGDNPLQDDKRQAFKTFLGITTNSPLGSQLRHSLLVVLDSHRYTHPGLKTHINPQFKHIGMKAIAMWQKLYGDKTQEKCVIITAHGGQKHLYRNTILDAVHSISLGQTQKN